MIGRQAAVLALAAVATPVIVGALVAKHVIDELNRVIKQF